MTGPVLELTDRGYLMSCPGCTLYHFIQTDPDRPGPCWTFDGNLDAPTFSPSVRATMEYGDKRERRVCHFFVRAGRIQYLDDCTHDLAGQTVPMVPVE